MIAIKKFKILLWLLPVLIILTASIYHILGLNIFFIESKNDIVLRATVTSKEFSDTYDIWLPDEAYKVDYYQKTDGPQTSDLYARIMFRSNLSSLNLTNVFKEMSYHHVDYVKTEMNVDLIPGGVPESWWNTTIIGKCDYYESNIGYEDMRFWVDMENGIVFMHE